MIRFIFRVDDPRIVRSLWVAFEDFFNENRSRDVHKVGFLMMQAMIEGQYDRLQLLRPGKDIQILLARSIEYELMINDRVLPSHTKKFGFVS